MQIDSQPEVAESVTAEEQQLLEREAEGQQLSECNKEAQPLNDSEELRFFNGDMDEEDTYPVHYLKSQYFINLQFLFVFSGTHSHILNTRSRWTYYTNLYYLF